MAEVEIIVNVPALLSPESRLDELSAMRTEPTDVKFSEPLLKVAPVEEPTSMDAPVSFERPETVTTVPATVLRTSSLVAVSSASPVMLPLSSRLPPEEAVIRLLVPVLEEMVRSSASKIVRVLLGFDRVKLIESTRLLITSLTVAALTVRRPAEISPLTCRAPRVSSCRLAVPILISVAMVSPARAFSLMDCPGDGSR